jgi:hypothetical protein
MADFQYILPGDAQRILWPENDAICQSPALGEISRMAVFMEVHGYSE